MDDAKRSASRPGLTALERADIFERAGDRAAVTIRRGYAIELYFEAASALDSLRTPASIAGIKRLYDKCLDQGLDRNFVGVSNTCEDIRELAPTIGAAGTPGRVYPQTSSASEISAEAPPSGGSGRAASLAPGRRGVAGYVACHIVLDARQPSYWSRPFAASLPVDGLGNASEADLRPYRDAFSRYVYQTYRIVQVSNCGFSTNLTGMNAQLNALKSTTPKVIEFDFDMTKDPGVRPSSGNVVQ